MWKEDDNYPAERPGRLAAVYTWGPEGPSRVGRGGYGDVYRAVRRHDDRTVALKLIDMSQLDGRKRERCLREVRALLLVYHLVSLSHSQIF